MSGGASGLAQLRHRPMGAGGWKLPLVMTWPTLHLHLRLLIDSLKYLLSAQRRTRLGWDAVQMQMQMHNLSQLRILLSPPSRFTIV